MHTKRIIPCLDVNNGRVVKGVNFVSLRDAEDPERLQRHMIKQGRMNWYFWILLHLRMRGGQLSIWSAK